MARTRVFIFSLMLGLTAGVAARACPMCKDSVPESDASTAAGVPAGMNASVFLLLGTMTAVLGGVTVQLVRASRKSF